MGNIVIEGKTLEITPATFQESMTLVKALADAVKGDGVRFDMSTFTIDFDNVENSEFGEMGGVIDSALSVVSDEGLRSALFACAERCMYDKKKINIDFFENVDNRSLYFPIMGAILKEVLGPFLGKLSSPSIVPTGWIGKFLKSKSTPE